MGPSSNRTFAFPFSNKQLLPTTKVFAMFHLEEILITVLLGSISCLLFAYFSQKRTGKAAGTGQRRPKVLASVLEQIETRVSYNERIKRASSQQPPNIKEAEALLGNGQEQHYAQHAVVQLPHQGLRILEET